VPHEPRDIIAKIRQNADAIRHSARARLPLWIALRDEASSSSDVDVFIDRDPAKHSDLSS
jgi:predicted nucleotidyltransferase